MSTGITLGARIEGWAQDQTTIDALILIGSRARLPSDLASADQNSDWDYQAISSRPEIFYTRSWLTDAGLDPFAYVVRPGRMKSAVKVSAVCAQGQLDLVIIPSWQLRLARALFALRVDSIIPAVSRGLYDLALVQRPGFQVVKGGRSISKFFQRIITSFPAQRLDTDAAIAVAEGFVCDYLSTRNKIERGEFIAAQRWLHHHLVEANLRLLHELAIQRGFHAYPDGRRLEHALPDTLLRLVGSEARPDECSLSIALEQVASSCCTLMGLLVGDKWKWPPDCPITSPIASLPKRPLAHAQRDLIYVPQRPVQADEGFLGGAES